MKSWVKGGLIGAGIIFFMNIIGAALISYTSGDISNFGETIYLLQAITIGIPLFLLGILDFEHLSNIGNLFIFTIWSMIIFFIIGSIIGLIISKIKSKDKEKKNVKR